jgi:hypothetical protein
VSLDVAAVAGQVRQMGQDIAATQSDFRDCVRWARLLLRENSQRHAEIAANIRQSKELRTARAALPKEPLATRRAAPPCPDSYVAAAADGSQAEPDRHGHVAYYLINTGTALIRYGPDASASFRSLPHLYYRHEDMYIVEELQPDGPVGKEPREAQIDGEILAMKRAVAEVEDLAKLAQNVPDDTPAVLMVDGTLPLFAKTTGDDAWVGELLKEKYRAALDDIRGMELPVVGFISRSNASWVMDMLQVGVCRRKTDSCAFCHGRDGGQGPACALARLRDRFLYDGTIDEPEVPSPLQPGERSALFQMSAGLYRDYGWNEPCMFYLNTGREIAQVQVPMWLTRKEGLLNQVHALVYAQCANGGGYPTVLTRAHEQAVVSAADRETLDALVLIQLLKLGVRVPVSEKARSKQVRGI